MVRLALVASLAACTSVAVDSGRLEAQLDIDLRDTTLTASLGLHDTDLFDDAAYSLAPDESLHATFHGHRVPLVLDHHADMFAVYSGTLTLDSAVAADEPIVTTFDRGDAGVIELTATTTPDFVLQAAASAPQPVTVTWSPTAADRIEWDSSSMSVAHADGAIQIDTGQLVFPPGVLVSPPPEAPTAVTIDIARGRQTKPRTALGSTSVAFRRWHTATIEVTP